MSDDIKTRLQESAALCLTCYEAWSGNKKDDKAKEALLEAVHELRKVGARLEIELAVSDRDEGGRKRIPIPAHRDAQKGGNSGEGDDSDKGGKGGGGKNRRPRPKKNNNNDSDDNKGNSNSED